MEKKVVAVLFGGQSSEHEVSCMRIVVPAFDRAAETFLNGNSQRRYLW